MSRVQDWLNKELAKIPKGKVVSPEDRVGENEIPHFVLDNDYQRRFFILLLEVKRKFITEEFILKENLERGGKCRCSETEGECLLCAKQNEVNALEHRLTTLGMMFSFEIFLECIERKIPPVEGDFTIREGWQVVIVPPPTIVVPLSGLLSLLKKEKKGESYGDDQPNPN